MPAEAVEGLTELGVGGGGVAQDGEALRGERVVDQGDVHRRESLAGRGRRRPRRRTWPSVTMQAVAPTELVEATASESALRRFLHGLPGVDQVGCGGAGGRSRHPLDQEGGQAPRPRSRRAHDRPHHARRGRHARQGAVPVREGPAARPGRPRRAAGGRHLHLPRPGAGGPPGAAGFRREGGQRGHGVPVGTGRRRREAGRCALGRRRRRRRDRHGDRPRRLPRRSLRRGAGGDPAGEGGVRLGPPQGDPRDGRARHPRQRAAGVVARR